MHETVWKWEFSCKWESLHGTRNHTLHRWCQYMENLLYTAFSSHASSRCKARFICITCDCKALRSPTWTCDLRRIVLGYLYLILKHHICAHCGAFLDVKRPFSSPWQNITSCSSEEAVRFCAQLSGRPRFSRDNRSGELYEHNQGSTYVTRFCGRLSIFCQWSWCHLILLRLPRPSWKFHRQAWLIMAYDSYLA